MSKSMHSSPSTDTIAVENKNWLRRLLICVHEVLLSPPTRPLPLTILAKRRRNHLFFSTAIWQVKNSETKI